MIIDRLDEEFLLFALRRDGSWHAGRHLSVGIASAWLMELMREGRIKLELKRLVPKGKSLLDDPALDPILKLIHGSKRNRSVTYWIQTIAKTRAPGMEAVMRRLWSRGYIEIVKTPTGTLYPMHGSHSRQEIRDHLRDVILGKADRSKDSMALLCLLGASGMTDEVFGETRRQEAEGRIFGMVQFDHELLYMWKSIRGSIRWGAAAVPPKPKKTAVQFTKLATR